MKIYLSLFLTFSTCFCLTAQNVPIDFETSGNGADWTWTVFENDTNPPLEIIANPDPTGLNTSATVAKFTALQTGQPFVGCESLHGADIGSFTVDSSSSTIRILVWKSVISDVGIKLVRADNWSLGEIKIANTLVNEWEQLEFDFSAHIGNTYDQIVIFPDFNAREADNIIYFDEVYGDVAMSTSTTALEQIDLKLFPNPANDLLSIQANESIDDFAIYALTGSLLIYEENTSELSTIDIASLPQGMYLLKATSGDLSTVKRFVKR